MDVIVRLKALGRIGEVEGSIRAALPRLLVVMGGAVVAGASIKSVISSEVKDTSVGLGSSASLEESRVSMETFSMIFASISLTAVLMES
jgi:hypothetical protein